MNSASKKICMLGDFAVGKTSLVERFVYHRFENDYSSSIGVNIYRKALVSSSFPSVQFIIWDLAGGEKNELILSSYLMGSSAAILVADLTRSRTLDILEGYITRFRKVIPDAPMLLTGNKSDLEYDEDTLKSLKQLGVKYHSPVILTSAKTGEAVEHCFSLLAQEMAI